MIGTKQQYGRDAGMFDVNHPILFVLAGVIILAVLGQSVFFLLKAWKRGVAIGMGKEKLKKRKKKNLKKRT